MDVRDNIFPLPVVLWITDKYHLPFDLDLDFAGAYVGPAVSTAISILPGSTSA